MAQYHRFPNMVKTAGIPKTTGKDLIKIIDRMATKSGITHFDVGQINVVRRTSPTESAPINIFFLKKSERMNFYYQKKRF